jgi:hypothetical protein
VKFFNFLALLNQSVNQPTDQSINQSIRKATSMKMPSYTRSTRFTSSHQADSSSNLGIGGKHQAGNNDNTDLSDALRDKCVIGAEKPEDKNGKDRSTSEPGKKKRGLSEKPKPRSSWWKKLNQAPPVRYKDKERPKKQKRSRDDRDDRGPRRAIFRVKTIAEMKRIKEERRLIRELH